MRYLKCGDKYVSGSPVGESIIYQCTRIKGHKGEHSVRIIQRITWEG